MNISLTSSTRCPAAAAAATAAAPPAPSVAKAEVMKGGICMVDGESPVVRPNTSTPHTYTHGPGNQPTRASAPPCPTSPTRGRPPAEAAGRGGRNPAGSGCRAARGGRRRQPGVVMCVFVGVGERGLCVCFRLVSVDRTWFLIQNTRYTHIHTHAHIYIYISMYGPYGSG